MSKRILHSEDVITVINDKGEIVAYEVAGTIWIVLYDDGNSQTAEIDIDSIWNTHAEATTRKAQITNARTVWIEGRRIGEPGSRARRVEPA